MLYNISRGHVCMCDIVYVCMHAYMYIVNTYTYYIYIYIYIYTFYTGNSNSVCHIDFNN